MIKNKLNPLKNNESLKVPSTNNENVNVNHMGHTFSVSYKGNWSPELFKSAEEEKNFYHKKTQKLDNIAKEETLNIDSNNPTFDVKP